MERVSLGCHLCEHKIRPSVCGFISQLTRSYSKTLFFGNHGTVLMSRSSPQSPLRILPYARLPGGGLKLSWPPFWSTKVVARLAPCYQKVGGSNTIFAVYLER